MSSTAFTTSVTSITATRDPVQANRLYIQAIDSASRRTSLALPSFTSLDLSSPDLSNKRATWERIIPAISSLSPADRARFLLFGIGADIPKPFDCVHHAFAARATATPNAIAVEHLGDTLTYERLDILSSALATTLRARGIQPGKRICLLVQRSIAMIVGIVATHKAGASYIPLDGGIVTDQTLGTILEDSGAPLVLCTPEYKNRVPDGFDYISLDHYLVNPQAPPTHIEDLSSPQDEAYVIYTSGSFLARYLSENPLINCQVRPASQKA
jgi:non-ribosomal peptide synthetase component F